jgi:hypothetical protein
MTSPQRVAWVEQKFAQHNVNKVIPPEAVAQAQLSKEIEQKIKAQVQLEALRSQAAWIAQQIEARMAEIELPTNINSQVTQYLKRHRNDRWTHAIDAIVTSMLSERVY